MQDTYADASAQHAVEMVRTMPVAAKAEFFEVHRGKVEQLAGEYYKSYCRTLQQSCEDKENQRSKARDKNDDEAEQAALKQEGELNAACKQGAPMRPPRPGTHAVAHHTCQSGVFRPVAAMWSTC